MKKGLLFLIPFWAFVLFRPPPILAHDLNEKLSVEVMGDYQSRTFEADDENVEDIDKDERAYLLGDFGGKRESLEVQGITFELVLTLDMMYNLKGGISRNGTVLGNMDLTMEIDTEKAGMWENGTFFVYVLGNFKANKFLTEIVGDIQATSNIEAEEALKLYEAWYEHTFFDDKLSLLAGLHDFNSEFDVLEYGGLFINSSFGVSPDISQVGPSIFPSTALGGLLKAQFNNNIFIKAAIYDGVPGDPDDSRRTAIQFNEGDGVFTAVEVGLSNGDMEDSDYYKIAAGSWLHTATTENFAGIEDDENKGIYLIGEKKIFTETDGEQGLGAFIQLGFADEDRNQIASYYGFGLYYRGLIPGRNNDITGLAVAHARNSDSFMNFSRDSEGINVKRAETAIELTYRTNLYPWLTIQPDIQYVINPGMNPGIDDALIAGARLEISF